MVLKYFPYYQQLDSMDFSPSCLRMIAKYYGHSYSLPNLRLITALLLDPAALVSCTFYQWALIAERIDSLSISLIGDLCPCPDFMYKPDVPSVWIRITQWSTGAKVKLPYNFKRLIEK